ncbi:uncharacterized protein LOC126902125 [Daktulosphaira vitifoliae]|uniref:uncharacterized protein LOC126902125 n=1 Tax=Daktulosphaira vitifoliae TaxID=58002 RepID=UPI0021AAFE37|nr:uncharacterized protein LOC126902125 [Daktulosphaira vitifoliae]
MCIIFGSHANELTAKLNEDVENLNATVDYHDDEKQNKTLNEECNNCDDIEGIPKKAEDNINYVENSVSYVDISYDRPNCSSIPDWYETDQGPSNDSDLEFVANIPFPNLSSENRNKIFFGSTFRDQSNDESLESYSRTNRCLFHNYSSLIELAPLLSNNQYTDDNAYVDFENMNYVSSTSLCSTESVANTNSIPKTVDIHSPENTTNKRYLSMFMAPSINNDITINYYNEELNYDSDESSQFSIDISYNYSDESSIPDWYKTEQFNPLNMDDDFIVNIPFPKRQF